MCLPIKYIKLEFVRTGQSVVNPLYTNGLFHCYMLDESICHFRGVGSILSLLVFLMGNPVSKHCGS